MRLLLSRFRPPSGHSWQKGDQICTPLITLFLSYQLFFRLAIVAPSPPPLSTRFPAKRGTTSNYRARALPENLRTDVQHHFFSSVWSNEPYLPPCRYKVWSFRKIEMNQKINILLNVHFYLLQ